MFSKHLNGNKKEIEEKEKVCERQWDSKTRYGGSTPKLTFKKVYITVEKGFVLVSSVSCH